MSPPSFDIWLMRHLASLSSRAPLLNLVVESGIETHVFGGIWYAAVLFVLWTEGVQLRQRSLRTRLLTVLWASLLAGAFSVVAGHWIAWTPPRNHPDLAPLYPIDLWPNSNANSFPSQSTAVYVALAAGIHSLRRRLGTFLWVITAVFVAFPRVYVGGHYPTDVLGGLLVGVAAYLVAARLLEPRLSGRFASIIDGEHSWRRVLLVLGVFLWIFEIATGFHEAVWLIAAFRHNFLSGG